MIGIALENRRAQHLLYRVVGIGDGIETVLTLIGNLDRFAEVRLGDVPRELCEFESELFELGDWNIWT